MTWRQKLDEAERHLAHARSLFTSACEEINALARDSQMWQWAQLPPVYVPPVGDIGLTRDSSIEAEQLLEIERRGNHIATNGYVLFVRGRLLP